jgi:hypothetical protein
VTQSPSSPRDREAPPRGTGATEPGPEPRLTREQLLIIAGMMVTLALAALDATVVGTALPTHAGQLGGLQLLGWVRDPRARSSRAEPGVTCSD